LNDFEVLILKNNGVVFKDASTKSKVMNDSCEDFLSKKKFSSILTGFLVELNKNFRKAFNVSFCVNFK
jgi:hypothetical protein